MIPFEKLRVWQVAHQLTLGIYAATRHFPAEERFGITSQIRRAAVSIPAHIAEGSRRRTRADVVHFLTIAQGSNEEVKYLLILSADLKQIPVQIKRTLSELTDRVGALLYSLSKQLKSIP